MRTKSASDILFPFPNAALSKLETNLWNIRNVAKAEVDAIRPTKTKPKTKGEVTLKPRVKRLVNIHIIASIAVWAVLIVLGGVLPRMAERGVSGGMQFVGALAILAVSPVWVPILLIGAPLYATIKGIFPSYWLAVEWSVYLVTGCLALFFWRDRSQA